MVPAHDEADRIEAVVRDLRAAVERSTALADDAWELIVVDDASGDATPAVLDGLLGSVPQLGVIRIDDNVGHGPALRTGWEAATGRWVAMFDGDGEVPPDQLDELWRSRVDGGLVIGRRRGRRQAPARRLVSGGLRTIASRIARRPIDDANVPAKLVDRRLLVEACAVIPAAAFAPSLLLVIASARLGRPIEVVEVSVAPDDGGGSWLVPRRLVAACMRSALDIAKVAHRTHDSPPESPLADM